MPQDIPDSACDPGRWRFLLHEAHRLCYPELRGLTTLDQATRDRITSLLYDAVHQSHGHPDAWFASGMCYRRLFWQAVRRGDAALSLRYARMMDRAFVEADAREQGDAAHYAALRARYR